MLFTSAAAFDEDHEKVFLPENPLSTSVAQALLRLSKDRQYTLNDYRTMLSVLGRMDIASGRVYIVQADIAKSLGVDSSVVSRSIKKFVGTGFLSKQEGSMSGRWYNYLIHPSGAPRANIMSLADARRRREAA